MELTDEILIKNGFDNNHPERVLNKFYLHSKPSGGPEYRIMVEKVYKPMTNILGYSVSAWKTNDKRVIVYRASCGIIDTVEDLQMCITLCHINKDII